MNFKKKLKLRLYNAVIYAILGLTIVIGVFATKPENDFLSSFGLILVVIGIARIRNYFIITKSEENIRRQQIIETDERNLSIMHKAKSSAFSIYIFLLGMAVIILSLLDMHNIAKWISCFVCLMIIIYWLCYWFYQKKS